MCRTVCGQWMYSAQLWVVETRSVAAQVAGNPPVACNGLDVARWCCNVLQHAHSCAMWLCSIVFDS